MSNPNNENYNDTTNDNDDKNKNQYNNQDEILSIPCILKNVFLTGFFLLIIFHLLAWKLFWIEIWLFVGLFIIFCCINALWLRKHSPQLLSKRMNPKKSNDEWEPWDKTITMFLKLFVMIQIILIGLDGGRYHWIIVSNWAKILGFIGFFLSFLIIHFVLRQNPYLSKRIEIQRSDGHEVIKTGLYSVIRHPMNIGMILIYLSFSLALGSLFGLIPGLINCGLMVYRTYLEDKVLQEKLPDYIDYVKETKYRLIPWIW